MSKTQCDYQGSEEVIIEEELREPPLYKVLLHNDDYTSMDFVTYVLMKIFHKNTQEAKAIMLAVHEQGIGLCGIYTREIAETKVAQVRIKARDAGYPLLCTCECEED